jgi:hypothetical protein
MPIDAWLQGLEQTALAVRIRDGLYLFPFLESAHVIGLTIVFGTILVIDLRLLGLASSHRPFERIAGDTLKWTLAAFVLTAITGALMFITNAGVYFHNTYFRVKVLLLVLAALNAIGFELTARRHVSRWGDSGSPPPLARAIAVASLVIWLGVIVTGRMIGFTATRAQHADPAPVNNLEELLGLPQP